MSHVASNRAVSDGRLLTQAELDEVAKHAFVHGLKYPWSQEPG